MECSVPNEALFTPPLREAWVRACCAVGEGACVVAPPHSNAAAAALGDAQQRVTTLGGRRGYARSLGSVAAGAIALFLGVETYTIRVEDCWTHCTRIAAHPGGSTVLLCIDGDEIQVRQTSDGELVSYWKYDGFGGRDLGLRGICFAPDGAVFLADRNNHCVLALGSDFKLRGIIGADTLFLPNHVSASADMVAVCFEGIHPLALFRRADGVLLRHLPGRWHESSAFLRGGRELAVVELIDGTVNIFSVDGVPQRQLGRGLLKLPFGIACTIHGEVVVADTEGPGRLVVFNACGDACKVIGRGMFRGLAVSGNTVFALSSYAPRYTSICVAFR